MGNSKITYFGDTLIDLTGDTVAPDKVLQGYTFHDASGTLQAGTRKIAWIRVKYTSDFYNKWITCTNGIESYMLKASSYGGGVANFEVSTSGTWNIYSDVGGVQYTTSVQVADSNQPTYEASLSRIPDGSTELAGSIQTWLHCAGIFDKSYTAISEVLADREVYERLLSNKNAAKYMVRSTDWADAVTATADSMYYLGKYACTCDALLNNATWHDAIFASDYWYYVLKVKVPIKVANTTAASVNVAQPEQCFPTNAYNAFDEDPSSGAFTGASPGYRFTSRVKIRKASLTVQKTGNTTLDCDYQVFGSNDGTNWTAVSDAVTQTLVTTNTYSLDIDVNPTIGYTYYKVENTTITGHRYWMVQFYGTLEPAVGYIYSAASDEIHYVHGNKTGVLTTTNIEGIGVVDWSELEPGIYTLYSSVAKYPDDTSYAYYQIITVTEDLAEVYLMPYHTLYWYGYGNGASYASAATTGVVPVTATYKWTTPSSWSFAAPQFRTNSIYAVSTKDNTYMVYAGTILKVGASGVIFNTVYFNDTGSGYVYEHVNKSAAGSTNLRQYWTLTNSASPLKVNKALLDASYVRFGTHGTGSIAQNITIVAVYLTDPEPEE